MNKDIAPQEGINNTDVDDSELDSILVNENKEDKPDNEVPVNKKNTVNQLTMNKTEIPNYISEQVGQAISEKRKLNSKVNKLIQLDKSAKDSNQKEYQSAVPLNDVLVIIQGLISVIDHLIEAIDTLDDLNYEKDNDELAEEDEYYNTDDYKTPYQKINILYSNLQPLIGIMQSGAGSELEKTMQEIVEIAKSSKFKEFLNIYGDNYKKTTPDQVSESLQKEYQDAQEQLSQDVNDN